MTDAQLNAHLVALLSPRAASDAILGQFPDLRFVQNYDPTQQGRDDTATVYFVKIGHKRYGWKRTRATYVETTPPLPPPAPRGTMQYEEMQILQQQYQFAALVPQDNERPALPTPADVLDAVAGIINSDRFLADLRARGIGVLRITDVRNPSSTDDRDHFEAEPSFDVVFIHERSRVDVEQVVTGYDLNVQRV